MLDIGLSKYSGWDIVLRIKEQNPNVRIFVTSGYLEPDIKSEWSGQGWRRLSKNPIILVMLFRCFAVHSHKQLSKGEANNLGQTCLTPNFSSAN